MFQIKIFLLTLCSLLSLVYCLTDLNCQNKQCECIETGVISCRFNNLTTSVRYLPVIDITGVEVRMSSLEQISFEKSTPRLQSLNLRCNNFKNVPDKQFENVPNLQSLDLSMNYIERMSEVTLHSLQKLERLNLSEAFASGFVLGRQICEAVSVKVLDLSFLNVANLSLGCWKNNPVGLNELHLRHSRNVQSSWSNWFPYIGTQLQLLDLTDTGLVTLDPNFARNQPNFVHLILSNNPSIDKTLLTQLLKTNDLITRLSHLQIKNISANSQNFPLDTLINHSDNISLIQLDISRNNFSDLDLNMFLFNQAKFKNLQVFKASNAQLTTCKHELISTAKTLLPALSDLDISNNQLNDFKCLHSIKLCTGLQRLNLSNNQLNLLHADLVSAELSNMLADMLQLTHLDFSFNKITELTLNMNRERAKIILFDLSHNALEKFRFLSVHAMTSAKFPFNLDDDVAYEDYDYNSDEVSLLNKHPKSDYYDDDERFVLISKLDLSHNKFKRINLHHMLQSISNIETLDLSNNPMNAVDQLSGERSIINSSQNAQEKVSDDTDLTEIICIDELNLSNCHIRNLPNLEHTCISKISLAYNALNGTQHLVISSFSTFFLDYLNLSWNNITELKPIISNQKFKQDSYLHKNSPINYFLGSLASNTNGKVHTYVDLKHNKNYNCDCDTLVQFKKYASIQILSECSADKEFQEKCFAERQSMNSLNRKFRLLFGFISIVLIAMTSILVYYMCSDCIKNMQPWEHLQFYIRQFVYRFAQSRFESEPSGSSKVIYSKLDDEVNTSNINLEIHS